MGVLKEIGDLCAYLAGVCTCMGEYNKSSVVAAFDAMLKFVYFNRKLLNKSYEIVLRITPKDPGVS